MRDTKAMIVGVVILAGLLWLVPAVGLAQQQPEPRPLDRPELGLSDEQKDQIRQIRASQQEKMQAIRQDGSLSPEEKRVRMQEVREETRSRITSVLTPEQREKLKQMQQERRGHMGRRGGRRGPQGQRPGRSGGGTGD